MHRMLKYIPFPYGIHHLVLKCQRQGVIEGIIQKADNPIQKKFSQDSQKTGKLNT